MIRFGSGIRNLTLTSRQSCETWRPTRISSIPITIVEMKSSNMATIQPGALPLRMANFIDATVTMIRGDANA